MQQFINIVLYGNFFIGACAAALGLQTFLLLEQPVDYWMLLLIFSATVSLYSLHRLIGLGKIPKTDFDFRFETVSKHGGLLKIISVTGAFAAAVSFIFIPLKSQILLSFLSLPSLLYVIPFLGGKRLRDFSYLKIFLIALIWSLATAALPAAAAESGPDSVFMLLLAERALFVFAITVPFDIRDMELEKKLNVKTLPSALGVHGSIVLSLAVLLLWSVLVHFIYPATAAIVLDFNALIAAMLIFGSSKKRDDFYYTALLDGTMLLQGLSVSAALYLN